MSLNVGIPRFLGTNCDEDVKRWIESKGFRATYLWYEDRFESKDFDWIVIPGGFSHGDYLRCGALAARTPVMKSVQEFASKGKPILGICNGFQILCEAQLLPGVLLQNKNLRFIDQWQTLTVQNADNPFSKMMTTQQHIRLPIAHGDGQYYADSETLQKINNNGQIWLTYDENPNGSALNIAGVTNEKKNVCALMPHPERAQFEWMGSSDGELFL
ncbi:MAG: phosphoribosylformylglycinamidine synthase I [Bdellovibrionales bacterium RIFCSPHIGHO2_01_FULL_40_29]|nr:MAG: phosphoribosylformylglycinamidine synthase I [Bdellovibrionales bacterium RIFCSPHIGHO2_01_FULL_40_29]OFZ35627.1 MAG: phosphoribosylformylglycinamidine synthase I [Bdellovibrionales bacterium RIFCSPHIGHO2_02_FULL_40_15]